MLDKWTVPRSTRRASSTSAPSALGVWWPSPFRSQMFSTPFPFGRFGSFMRDLVFSKKPIRWISWYFSLRWSRFAQQKNPYWWEDEQKSPNEASQICLVTPQFLWCDPGFSELVVLWERQICFKCSWNDSFRKGSFTFSRWKKLEDFWKNSDSKDQVHRVHSSYKLWGRLWIFESKFYGLWSWDWNICKVTLTDSDICIEWLHTMKSRGAEHGAAQRGCKSGRAHKTDVIDGGSRR